MSILQTVNLEGLHWKQSNGNGFFSSELPFVPPEDASFKSWDADTMTITYEVPGDEEGSVEEVGRVITQAEIDESLAERLLPKPPRVPEKVSKAQLKLALIASGIDLDSLVNGLPEESRPLAQVLINDATHFERSAPMVSSLASVAGLDDSQVDDLFIQAGSIDPATY